jgi:hypothetical protein
MKFSRTINQRQLSVRLVMPTILYSPYLARAYYCRKSEKFERTRSFNVTDTVFTPSLSLHQQKEKRRCELRSFFFLEHTTVLSR